MSSQEECLVYILMSLYHVESLGETTNASPRDVHVVKMKVEQLKSLCQDKRRQTRNKKTLLKQERYSVQINEKNNNMKRTTNITCSRSLSLCESSSCLYKSCQRLGSPSFILELVCESCFDSCHLLRKRRRIFMFDCSVVVSTTLRVKEHITKMAGQDWRMRKKEHLLKRRVGSKHVIIKILPSIYVHVVFKLFLKVVIPGVSWDDDDDEGEMIVVVISLLVMSWCDIRYSFVSKSSS